MMKLRQVALVARDLAPVHDQLQSVLACGDGRADPAVGVFGLENVVLPLGDTFLEVVSPTRPGTAAGRLLDRRGGDGGYMVILQVDDLDAQRAQMQRTGVRIVWEATLDDMATIHLHPRDIGAAIVSLDQANPPEHWEWAGPGWEQRTRREPVAGISGVVLQSEDPAALAARWAEVLGREATPDGDGAVIGLDDDTHIHFVAARDERGDGVCAVELSVTDAAAILETARDRGLLDADGTVRICGTHFDLRERRRT